VTVFIDTPESTTTFLVGFGHFRDHDGDYKYKLNKLSSALVIKGTDTRPVFGLNEETLLLHKNKAVAILEKKEGPVTTDPWDLTVYYAEHAVQPVVTPTPASYAGRPLYEESPFGRRTMCDGMSSERVDGPSRESRNATDCAVGRRAGAEAANSILGLHTVSTHTVTKTEEYRGALAFRKIDNYVITFKFITDREEDVQIRLP
jgi:hypothetical protein